MENAPGYIDNVSSKRLIRIQEAQIDPIEPPKNSRQKFAVRPPSPPPVLVRSPPRKVSDEKLAEWKIPTAISNWTNPRGYVIPLDKRIAMDGHMAPDYKPPEKFVHVAEALALAEQIGRAEIEVRNRIRKSIEEKRQAEQEQKLREQALAARATLNSIQRPDISSINDTNSIKIERTVDDYNDNHSKSLELQEAKRERLRKEQEYALRHSVHKTRRTGSTKPLYERDISERIALQETIKDIDGSNTTNNVHYDERLFQMEQQQE